MFVTISILPGRSLERVFLTVPTEATGCAVERAPHSLSFRSTYFQVSLSVTDPDDPVV